MKGRTRAWDEAVRSLGMDPSPRNRPDVLHWLRYAFWGSLPERFQVWVLYDATCATWVLRHLGRLLTVAVLPVLAVVVFLPGPLGLRLLTALVASAAAFLLTAAWVNESNEHRLTQAGWREGIGPIVRQRRSQIAEWAAVVRKL